MATVYSSRFLQRHGGGSGSDIFVVPAGYVAVLRDLDGWINNVGGGSLTLQGALGQQIYAQEQVPATNGNVLMWRGRVVFEAGESITVVCVSAVDYVLCGYLLVL